ncbi:zinc-binding dehydrogenase [Actinomadura violacea]|uniref:Zinc-binding dehydrogenase n=1 Tax=Actinomadura violacea TaxID=2819934 RepID=A0ABS3RSX0_9ACTN|nr:zinc-binding dehydrogenase [Actinomadura violacea]MBO2459603.1 zinc-binding dehydrogenase [Actinomadura violacea]
MDGVGRLEDGTRVAFFGPIAPYGGMAERALVRRGMWFPGRDGVDDVTAAALLNPGGAAWKTVVWEGGAGPGKTVLVLGATGASGRIAVQVAKREGARVVAAGRDRTALGALAERGADAVVRLDRPKDEVVEAIVAHGPYDLVVDYLWGAPAEAAFAALSRGGDRRVRYILVGMSAGETAEIPAMALRAAPVEVAGSGAGGSPTSRMPGPVPRTAAASSSSPDSARRMKAIGTSSLRSRAQAAGECRWGVGGCRVWRFMWRVGGGRGRRWRRSGPARWCWT